MVYQGCCSFTVDTTTVIQCGYIEVNNVCRKGQSKNGTEIDAKMHDFI